MSANLTRDWLFGGVRRRVRARRGSRRHSGGRGGRPARDERGRLIVEYVPAPRAAPSSHERSALTAARTDLGMTVDDVVERLRPALGLGQGGRERLKRAYEDLESGLLPPAGVHDSVWNALRDILHVDARHLAGARTGTAPSHGVPDEVDVLFRGTGLL